jgi:hypothetical protein
MDERNFMFMFYGFAAAILIIAGYVILLGARAGKQRRQLDNLKRMIENREKL